MPRACVGFAEKCTNIFVCCDETTPETSEKEMDPAVIFRACLNGIAQKKYRPKSLDGADHAIITYSHIVTRAIDEPPRFPGVVYNRRGK